MYDIIGDIHGEYATLEALLQKLGYQHDGQSFKHPSRKAIFVGDFIDRGKENLRVVSTVRAMVEDGSALAIMGNHEFNAIMYSMPDPTHEGEFLRKHNKKHFDQHESFLDEIDQKPEQYADVIGWFKTLPLWIETPQFGVVHACWSSDDMDFLRNEILNDQLQFKNDDALIASSRKGGSAYNAIEAVLKGIECPLPEGQFFHDKEGNPRHEARINWWHENPQTLDEAISVIGKHNIDADALFEHFPLHNIRVEKPIFFGHYWRTGTPTILSPFHACTDWSVGAKSSNVKLAAYRHNNEKHLDDANWVYVDKIIS